MAKLIFRSGPYAGKSVSLPIGKTIVVGRNRDIDLPLPDLKLSRKHCQIAINDNAFLLKDLNSTNGTFVNGTRLSGEIKLNAFDRIVVGDTEMEFHDAEKAGDFVAPFGSHDSATATRQATAKTEEAEEEELEEIGADAEVVVGDTPAGSRQQAQLSPLELALKEMLLPLPPEPPPLDIVPEEAAGDEGGSAERAKVFFCDSCDASIPTSDWQLGNAKEFDGKNYCKDCIAKGVVVGTPVPKRPPAGSGSKTTRSVDEILAGLNEEAIVVDTTIKRRGIAVADAQVAESMGKFERATQSGVDQPPVSAPSRTPANGEPTLSKPPVPARAAPPPPKPAASSNAATDLGDEFEEIG